jgi:hypothetical protein
MTLQATEDVPNETLQVGDMVQALGWKRITVIRPYRGPLTDIIFAIADTDTGVGFSLEKGGYTTRVKRTA